MMIRGRVYSTMHQTRSRPAHLQRRCVGFGIASGSRWQHHVQAYNCMRTVEAVIVAFDMAGVCC
jgi:hypothetical protein